jgi:hypothetical protein
MVIKLILLDKICQLNQPEEFLPALSNVIAPLTFLRRQYQILRLPSEQIYIPELYQIALQKSV